MVYRFKKEIKKKGDMNDREEQRKIERQKKREEEIKILTFLDILTSILAVMCIIAIITQTELELKHFLLVFAIVFGYYSFSELIGLQRNKYNK